MRPSGAAGILSLLLASLVGHGPARGETGDGAAALPAVGLVDVAERLRPGVALASSAGYGYTESVLGTSDRHHRLGGTLAASVAPLDWLAIAGRLDGRYDWHLATTGGRDDGWTGEPRLLVRATTELGRVGLAGQASVWIPGRNAPSIALGATSFDLRALASVTPARSPVLFAATLGLRIDRSARSVQEPARMSDADRLALGVGEGPSLLTGLGLTAHVGRSLELLGEVTWDIGLDEFPSPLASPLRFGAGARWSVGRALALQALLEVLASERPDLKVDGPLAPIEPRASLTFTAIVRTGADTPRSAPIVGPRSTSGDARFATAPTQTVTVRTGTLRGRALASDGAVVPGARVRIAIGAAPPVEVLTDSQGRFVATAVPEGEGTIHVSAEGYVDTDRPVRIIADSPAEAELMLPRHVPRGQIRGSVTSVRGRAIEATIVVRPIGVEVRCGADGAFQVDVVPGTYTVELAAPGFRPQQRQVTVEEHGVTILNVDLRPRR